MRKIKRLKNIHRHIEDMMEEYITMEIVVQIKLNGSYPIHYRCLSHLTVVSLSKQ